MAGRPQLELESFDLAGEGKKPVLGQVWGLATGNVADARKVGPTLGVAPLAVQLLHDDSEDVFHRIRRENHRDRDRHFIGEIASHRVGEMGAFREICTGFYQAAMNAITIFRLILVTSRTARAKVSADA